MAEYMLDKTEPSLRSAHFSCHDCPLRRLCLPVSLHEAEINRLEEIIRRNRPLRKHDYLARAGGPVQHMYAVRSGAFKTYLMNSEGDYQITGFHFPGELIGLDALGADSYPSYSVALETSMVCAIPLHQLEELAGFLPGLRKQLLQTMSREIHAEHEHQCHARENAEQRLVAFLLNLSARFNKRGLSPANFILPMSRSDIANYLGMTTETVSRLFTRFRDLNLIHSAGRELRLLDIHALCKQGNTCAADRD